MFANRPPWFHVLVAILLLAGATTLDATRPFGKSFSITYLFPVFYTSWRLRGRLEVTIHLLAFLTAYMGNVFTHGRIFTFNRFTGTLVAFAVIGLMWERRRHIRALESANRDLEERVRARTQSLTDLNHEFKRLADFKTQFLRTMSHEIRTPLNAIIGVAGLLRDAQTEEERRGLIETLEHSTQVTLGIVNDILDLSQLEAGRMQIAALPFSLQSTMREVALIVEAEAKRKGLSLIDESSSCQLPLVNGDQRRVRQVLLNIAANAVKFTEQGFVHLQLQVLDRTADRTRVRVAVRDSGIGIPVDAQPQLFEKFTQADASIGRKFGGSGLGLAITKGLVDLMQGQIGVESEPGRGSNFWVVLEFPITASSPVDSPRPAPAANLVPARVLVVEDNSVNSRLVTRFLERLGCAGVIAANGQQALAALQESSFDIVFMDCHMPEMDGYETTRAIRNLESGSPRHTPIIAMTASVLAEDREACYRAGMDDFLPKPFSVDEFRAMLERWTLTRATAPISTPSATPAPQSAAPALHIPPPGSVPAAHDKSR